MNITVVGSGHVGLVTGVGLASVGHRVAAADISPERIEAISSGKSPFYEPGLDETLARVIRAGNFRIEGDLRSVKAADLIMICVGTPSVRDGAIDLSVLRKAVEQVTHALSDATRYQVVVVRSTVVPGTTEALVWPILKRSKRYRSDPLGLVVNPEFLREGRALEDFLNPDRIVIGELNGESGNLLSKAYEGFRAPVIRTNPATAEMIKYTSNALLATLISFSNEIAQICESVPDVDVAEVLEGVHVDHRLTHVVDDRRIPAGIIEYLRAGCGYGGSCLPKDLRGLIAFARKRGVIPKLLEAVNAVNVSQPRHLVDLAEQWVGRIRGKRALVLGLAFKAGTDDLRESAGIAVATGLLERGASVIVADPLVKEKQLGDLRRAGATFADDSVSAFMNADVCFITTRAPEFKFVENALMMASGAGERPVVVDGRRLLSQSALRVRKYIGIGVGVPGRANPLRGRRRKR